MKHDAIRKPRANGDATVEAVTGGSAKWASAGVKAHGSQSTGHDRWRAGMAMVVWTFVSAVGWLVIAVLAVSAT